MALTGFRYVGGFPELQAFEFPVTAGTAIATGDLLDQIAASNIIQRATSSSTCHTVFAVAAETISTAATRIKAIPICQGQLWRTATASDTHATNQTLMSCILTDHTTINNTGSDVTGPTGLFQVWAPIGAVGDRQVIGEFCRYKPTST